MMEFYEVWPVCRCLVPSGSPAPPPGDAETAAHPAEAGAGRGVLDRRLPWYTSGFK